MAKGRPRLQDAAKGHDRESYNRYMKEYMREYRRRGASGVDNRLAQYRTEPQEYRAAAIYDPARDGPVEHDSMTAVLMGDPPIGRRALDARG